MAIMFDRYYICRKSLLVLQMFENTGILGLILALVGIGVSSVAVVIALDIRNEEKEVQRKLDEERLLQKESAIIEILLAATSINLKFLNLKHSVGSSSFEENQLFFIQQCRENIATINNIYFSKGFLLSVDEIKIFSDFYNSFNSIIYKIENKTDFKSVASYIDVLKHIYSQKFSSLQITTEELKKNQDVLIEGFKRTYEEEQNRKHKARYENAMFDAEMEMANEARMWEEEQNRELDAEYEEMMHYAEMHAIDEDAMFDAEMEVANEARMREEEES